VTGDSIPALTGVSTIKKPTFSIFPNPARNKITICSPEFEYKKVDIVDMNGAKVFEQVLEKPVIGSTQLDIKLNAGFYIINLWQNEKNYSTKLLVE
jgi:hypothetical protein